MSTSSGANNHDALDNLAKYPKLEAMLERTFDQLRAQSNSTADSASWVVGGLRLVGRFIDNIIPHIWPHNPWLAVWGALMVVTICFCALQLPVQFAFPEDFKPHADVWRVLHVCFTPHDFL